MNAEVRPIKTAAETALAANFAAAKRALPGAAGGRGAARGRVPALRERRAAAPPGRGVEIHRPARAHARCQAARGRRPTRPPRRAPSRRWRTLGGDRGARASCSSTAPSCRNSPISPTSKPGLTIGSMAQALAAGDPQLVAHLGKVVPTDDVAVALNTAFMGDGAVIHVAAGVGAGAAAPSRLRRMPARSRPRSSSARSSSIEKGARAMLVESHVGSAAREDQVNAALELEVGDEAHVDHVKITGEGAGRPACLHA